MLPLPCRWEPLESLEYATPAKSSAALSADFSKLTSLWGRFTDNAAEHNKALLKPPEPEGTELPNEHAEGGLIRQLFSVARASSWNHANGQVEDRGPGPAFLSVFNGPL